jgi:hypothetical protein
MVPPSLFLIFRYNKQTTVMTEKEILIEMWGKLANVNDTVADLVNPIIGKLQLEKSTPSQGLVDIVDSLNELGLLMAGVRETFIERYNEEIEDYFDTNEK